MMYLTRILLNPHDRRVCRDLANCYEMHRTIMSMFPRADGTKDGARQEFNVLYRFEQDPRGRLLAVILQSRERPNLEALPAGYLLDDSLLNGNTAASTKSIDAMLARIKPGTTLRFRLRANPTWKTGTSTKVDRLTGKQRSNGKRHPIWDESEQLDWFVGKGLSSGFELLSVAVTSPGRRGENVKNAPVVSVSSRSEVVGRKLASTTSKLRPSEGSGDLGEASPPVEKGKQKMTFFGVTFEGYMKVTDREKFLKTIESGIGSAKSFGFGLLTIALVT